MRANDLKSIVITPNLKWSVELSNKTDFYIQDGNNEVYTKQGEMGTHTISVCSRNIVDYDEDHTCELTMTMNNETKKVATFTVNKIARDLKVYAALVDENGQLKEENDSYVFSTEPATAISLVEVDGNYIAPVKIESNFDYIISGPEWMAAATGSDANSVVTTVLYADVNKLPAEDATGQVQFIDANNEEKVGATLSLSISGSSNVMEIDYDENVIFTKDAVLYGKTTFDGTAIGYITSDKNADFVAVEKDGSEASWVTINAEWDDEGASIQERLTHISVDVNESESARVAYVFALPAVAAVEDVATLVVDGAVNEEYAKYLVTTLTQHSVAATITASNMVEPAYMSESEAEWPFNEGALSDFYIGSKYELLYVCSYDSDDSSFKASKEIKSFRTYAYNDAGKFADISGDDSWVKTNKESVAANAWFKIKMNPAAASAEAAKNLNTGDYEAVLLVEYVDGSYSAIFCRYNENATGGDSDGPQFAYPDYVWMDGTTLVELKEGDWYNMFYYEYGVPVYHLTYTSFSPSMSMFANLPEYCMNLMDSAWLSYEYGAEFQMISMAEGGNGDTGALLFYDGTGNKYIIVCTLMVEE